MDALEIFQSEVERYLKTTGLTPSAFGDKAAGDPNFVFELRNGREPRRATMAKVRAFMDRGTPVSRETRQGADAA